MLSTTDRGIVPRRFVAIVPIPEHQSNHSGREERGRAITPGPPLRSWPLGRRSGCSPAEPYPPPRLSFILVDVLPSRNHPRGTTSCRPTVSGFFQLAIALGEDDFIEPGELICRRHVTYCICKRQLL